MKTVDGKIEKNDESESNTDVKTFPEKKNVGNGFDNDQPDKDDDLPIHDEEICENNGYTGIVVVEEQDEELVNNNKH